MSSLRLLTFAIFAYTTVEGLVINISYPSTLPFIYKDFIIGLAYLSLLTDSRPTATTVSKITAPLVAFAFVMFFYLILPSQVSIVGELVAVKQRLFYIPLVWVGYHFLQKEDDFLALMKVMAWTSIPAGVFGIYLYFVGPIGLASLGANYSALISSTSGQHGVSYWRVPGTFTSPGQFGMFLLTNAILVLGGLFPKKADSRQRAVTVIALVIALAAIMVSGSRSPLLIFMLCSVALLGATGRLTGIGLWAGGLYGVFTVAFVYLGGGVQDRVGSIASWEHVERFRATYFGQLFWPFLQESPMGFGLGRATIGARHFTDWSNIMLVESYFGVIVAETGVIGFAAFLWVMAAILVTIEKCRAVMRTTDLQVEWYAIALLVLSIFFLMPISTAIDAAPGNLYFWFFLGVMFKFYDLEMARRARGIGASGTAVVRPASYPVSYQ